MPSTLDGSHYFLSRKKVAGPQLVEAEPAFRPPPAERRKPVLVMAEKHSAMHTLDGSHYFPSRKKVAGPQLVEAEPKHVQASTS